MLQELVSLIQVASEDKIALFHIGRHAGNTPEELIAPSLRHLIENAHIQKTGQSILGDAACLKAYFGLQPRGLSELSYFYILLTDDPEHSMRTRYVRRGLAGFVEHYFPGLTLEKDKTMHGAWTEALNDRQREYAAADVYASLMVWHRMNAKRLHMQHPPPLPLNAERYMTMDEGYPESVPVQLEPLAPGAYIMAAYLFFQLHENLDEDDYILFEEPLDVPTTRLFRRLARARAGIAQPFGIPPLHVASNYALRVIAKDEPRTRRECRSLLRGGPEKHLTFVDIWVDTILDFIKDGSDEDSSGDATDDEDELCVEQTQIADTEDDGKNRCS